MRMLFLSLLIFAGMPQAQGPGTFTGTITDSMCAMGEHAQMAMGPTAAECTIACVDAHGAAFVLYDGQETYLLTDQQASEKFAGKKVRISGTLNPSTKTIQVESIAAAD